MTHPSITFRWLAQARKYLNANGFRYLRVASNPKYQEHWARGALRAGIRKPNSKKLYVIEFN